MPPSSAPSSALPAELRARLEPAWHEIPRLAWVAARAYLPGTLPGGLAVAAGTCLIVVWLPSLVSLRAAHQLVALDGARPRRLRACRPPPRCRGVVATGARRPRRDRPRGARLGVIASGCALGAAYLGLDVESSAVLAAAIILVPAVTGLLSVAPVRVAGSLRRMRALTSWLAADYPGTPVWRLGPLAAWPQRSGHGTALLDQLLSESGGVVGQSLVVGWPRSSRPRAWYRRRLAMRENAEGGLYLLPSRAQLSQAGLLVVSVVVAVGYARGRMMDAASTVAVVGVVVHARQPGEGVRALHPPHTRPGCRPSGCIGTRPEGCAGRGSNGQHGRPLAARAAAAPVEAAGLLLMVGGRVGVVVLSPEALHLGDLGVGGAVLVHRDGQLRSCFTCADLICASAGLFLKLGLVPSCVVAHDLLPFVFGVVDGAWTSRSVLVS